MTIVPKTHQIVLMIEVLGSKDDYIHYSSTDMGQHYQLLPT